MKEAILQQKKDIVADIKSKFESCQSAVLIDYRGLTVEEVTNLRNKFREAGVEYRVLKNTMIRRAVEELGLEGLDPVLEGPTAVAFGKDRNQSRCFGRQGRGCRSSQSIGSFAEPRSIAGKSTGQHECTHHRICYGFVRQHPQLVVCTQRHWRKEERLILCA